MLFRSFSLSIYVRNIEDGTQILEQILPFFTPDFNVSVDFIPSMGRHYNVPVMLNSVASTSEYESQLEDGSTRLLIWDLTFTAKSWIWPPVKSGKIINTANTNLNIDFGSADIQKVYVDYANGNNVFTTGETIRDTANSFYGTVEYFSNNFTGTLVVTGANKFIEKNYTLSGDYSGALFNVASLDIGTVNAASVITTPTPNTALPNTNYGYDETINEFPFTI